MSGRDLLSLALAEVADTIRHHVRRYPPDLQDDLEQESNLAAIAAYHRYDPTKGASWPTFAERRIVGACQDYCRKRGRESPAESWESVPEYEQDGAVCLCEQSISNNPTVQRRIRLTVDSWAAVGFLAQREGVEVSSVMQVAVSAYLDYQERMLVRNCK